MLRNISSLRTVERKEKLDDAIESGAWHGEDTTGPFGNLGDDIADAVGDGLNSAWDVLSGERDYRRNKAATDLAWEREMGAANSEAQRRAADLARAGINPIQAGNLGGSSPKAQVPQSHTAQALSGGVNSAVGVLGGLTSLRTAMASIPNLVAQTRKTNADAAFVEASTPKNLRNLDLQGPSIEANTAASVALADKHKADTDGRKVDTKIQRLRLPQFHAESEYYKRYGRNAILADKNRNPWQSAQLMAGQVGDAITDSNLSTATDILSNKVRQNVESTAKRSAKARSFHNSYYTGRR